MSDATYRLAVLMMLTSGLAAVALALEQPWASLVAQVVATLLGAALVVLQRQAMRDARWDGWLPGPTDR